MSLFLGENILQSKGFSVEWLQELKRKNDLVSIASNYIHLEQKGRRFWACCPFHNEKTPSFTISAEDGIYYCFGCKESGDVIKFVEKMENIDFYGAVKLLADRVGMQLPELKSTEEIAKKQKLKERLLLCLDYAYKHYQENLYSKDAKVAQDYIKLRKLTRRELEDFKIGYSKDWNDIVNYLKSKGFSDYELITAGICGKKNERLYDVIGKRLVFPIFNSFNECIGFSARALEKTDFAKYLNTAETPVFQKGRIVFGINLLKKYKQQQGLKNIILVEGQMDVVAMHKGGFKQTVACMGTALTKDHVSELKRYSPNIVLCFDNDGAGTKATLRAIEMFRNEDVNLTVVKLDGGKDPDEVLNNLGPAKLQEMIDNAMPYMEYLIDYHYHQYDLNKAEEKGKFVKAVLGEIKKLESSTLQEPYLDKVRDLTNIPIEILRRDLGSEIQGSKTLKETPKVEVNVEKGNQKAVEFILASMLHHKEYVNNEIDYRKLLDGYGDYLDIIDKNLPLSSLYDFDEISEDKLLLNMINYNFNLYAGVEERYFKECLWLVAEEKLKKMQSNLNAEFKNCTDLTKRAEIAKNLGKIASNLKNKNLEVFYVRREN